MRQSIAAPLLVLVMTLSGVLPCGAQQAKPAAPIAVVAKLYQEYAGEAVIENTDLSTPDLFGRPKAAMARYLDEGLIALVMADRACAERTKEICNLDFMPIWDAQDATGATVELSATKDPARVLAEIRFADKTVSRVTYVLAQTPAGWRIHDIEYDKHESLVRMLEAKPI